MGGLTWELSPGSFSLQAFAWGTLFGERSFGNARLDNSRSRGFQRDLSMSMSMRSDTVSARHTPTHALELDTGSRGCQLLSPRSRTERNVIIFPLLPESTVLRECDPSTAAGTKKTVNTVAPAGLLQTTLKKHASTLHLYVLQHGQPI